MLPSTMFRKLDEALENKRQEGAVLIVSERTNYVGETTRVCQELVVCADELRQTARRVERLLNHEFR